FVFRLLYRPPPTPTHFPYTTLFRSYATTADNHASGLTFAADTNRVYLHSRDGAPDLEGEDGYRSAVFLDVDGSITGTPGRWVTVDRKSTRLNSSHVKISYAVFCLKK